MFKTNLDKINTFMEVNIGINNRFKELISIFSEILSPEVIQKLKDGFAKRAEIGSDVPGAGRVIWFATYPGTGEYRYHGFIEEQRKKAEEIAERKLSQDRQGNT